MQHPFTQEDYSLHKKLALSAALVIAALYAYWLKFDVLINDVRYIAVIALAVIIVLISPVKLQNDEIGNRVIWLFREFYVSAMLLFSVFGMMLLIGFGLKITEYYSREWSFYWAVGSVFSYLLIISAYSLYSSRFKTGHILIVGAGDIGERIGKIARRWQRYDVVGYLDDDPEKIGAEINGVKVLGNCSDVKTIVNEAPIAEVWITLPFGASGIIEEIINGISDQPVTIRYFPDINVFNLLNHSASSIAGQPVLVLNDSPLKGSNRLIKTIVDYLLSSMIILLISPLLLAIALGILLTSGRPILYKQKRHGAGGSLINVYKFRTMYQDNGQDGEVVQATRNDARITPFGKFLRRTSLDELPQFMNVLQGKMSIVGPRPHAVEHNVHFQQVIERYMLRHRVKPGITGWAQINGFRGETDTLVKMQKRVEYDLFYIQNWSVWLDLKIILLTVIKGFFHKNAY